MDTWKLHIDFRILSFSISSPFFSSLGLLLVFLIAHTIELALVVEATHPTFFV